MTRGALLSIAVLAGALLVAPRTASADDEGERVDVHRTTRVAKPYGFRIDGGHASRRLFDLGLGGADVGLALGGQPKRHFAWWVTPRFFYGGTDNGLRVITGRLGAELEAVYDPVRFGFGGAFMYATLSRASSQRPAIPGIGGELRAFVQVDLVRDDDYAMFVRGSFDVSDASGGVQWGPTIALGFELGISGKRSEAFK